MKVAAQPTKPAQWVTIGRIGRTFGLYGWAKVVSFTEPTTNILQYNPWYLFINNEWRLITIERKEQKNAIIVRLPDCQTPEQAKKYVNCDIGVKREQLKELSEDDHYWVDLMGLAVINKENILLGHVKDFLETGANDIVIVKNHDTQKEYLIPWVMKKFILQIDQEKKQILVDWSGEYL